MKLLALHGPLSGKIVQSHKKRLPPAEKINPVVRTGYAEGHFDSGSFYKVWECPLCRADPRPNQIPYFQEEDPEQYGGAKWREHCVAYHGKTVEMYWHEGVEYPVYPPKE